MNDGNQDCQCPKCLSMNIAATANVDWNVEDQCFDVQGVHDEWWCNDCGAEFSNVLWFGVYEDV